VHRHPGRILPDADQRPGTTTGSRCSKAPIILKAGPAFPALGEPVDHVRPAGETGRARDLQAPARLVQGEDVHRGQSVGMQHLPGEGVQGPP
jgi:hypothetical protein